jgi:hypothetical protein
MSDDYRRMLILMAMAAKLGSTSVRWPMENDVFVRTVQALPENKMAASFQLYSGVAGPMCPDWQELTSLALHAGMISYLSPEYRHFVSNVSGRGAKLFLTREAATDEELKDAEELLRRLYEEAGGLPLAEQ